MKKATLLLIPALLLNACHAPRETMPDQEFIAVGTYSHKLGAQEIAMDQAKDFCKRWGAAPGVISQRTTYKGTVVGGKAGETIEAVKEVVGYSGRNAYETEITYKCY